MTKEDFNKYLEKNYDELFSELFKYCFTFTNDKEEAEDVVQETFLKAIEYIDTYNYGNIKAWMFTIAKRTYLYKIARRKITKYDTLNEDQAKIDENIEDKMFSDLEKEKFKNNLNKLPTQLQELILYIDYLHFSYPSVAKILKIPLGTVKSRLHHARELLKKEYISDTRKDG